MDLRARKILIETYWSPSGWKEKADQLTSDDDFEYAKSKGLMFKPVELDHAEAQDRLLGVIRKLNRRVVADAFLASLSTRRLDWRSALGSYAVFQNLPKHGLTAASRQCAVCGLYADEKFHDLNTLNFERLKWGGVRHDQVIYASMDLELFLREDPPDPTAEDVHIFKALLSAIALAPPGTSSSALQSHFPKELKANKSERDVLIGILGYCGILGTADHPGFSSGYVAYDQRRLPDRRFVDMAYPSCWWTAGAGANVNQLSSFFGHAL